MRNHHKYFVGAAVSLVTWIALAFVWAVPQGWVHIPLGLGAVLIALGIIAAPPPGEAR